MMLIFTIFDVVIPGVIFIPAVSTVVFAIVLPLALWLDERAEKKSVA